MTHSRMKQKVYHRRACALVGDFLHTWSQMELCLHDAIGAALRLNGLTQFILCANLQLRDTLNILRCIVDVSNLSNEKRAHFTKRLCDLHTYVPHRNMIAHDSFEANDSGTGVEFSLIKAKKGFSLPIETWTKDRFKKEHQTMVAFAEDLIMLRDSLKTSDFDHKRVTRLITIPSPLPSSSSGLIRIPNHRAHHIQDAQDSSLPPPMPKKRDKKHLSASKKEPR
jgi:hypothetical protein